MEKQANKYAMKINFKFLLFLLLPFISLFQTKAQESKFYIINDIKFEGLHYYNPQTVKAFIGVNKGDLLEIPGNKTAEIVQRLWDSHEFDDVKLYIEPVSDQKADLIIVLKEVPILSDIKFKGIPKSRAKSFIKDLKLNHGTFHVNSGLLKKIERTVTDYYVNKGFLNVNVGHRIEADTTGKARVIIRVNKGNRVKIKKIVFHGNKSIPAHVLRRKMKKTKRVNFLRFWKRSKFIRDDYVNDKKLLEEFYQSKGFRNAHIIRDSISRVSPDRLQIDLWLNEGKKYYFRHIYFKGNTVYTDEYLAKILGIKKGDPYNGKLLKERIQNPKKPDGIDLTNLYQNNGYLFSHITPVELGIEGDSIDFEIRIYEGKVAYFNNISVSGNDRTKDYVIYRELRTRPGDKYNKELVVRTVRELAQLGYFNPESIKPQFKNVDPVNGSVDIDWNVEEGGASQIQLQGGFSGRGTFIGTVAISLNNFALGDIFKGKEWKPIPMGEGQRFSVSGNWSFLYESYQFGFTEPWLGGKKPQAFSLNFYKSKNFYPKEGSYYERDVSKYFSITGLSIGLGQRLKWPDDYFQLYQSVSWQHYRLKDYTDYYTGISATFGFRNGISNNLAYNISLSRLSSGPNPIFPLEKSDFSISLKLTPPYSLFNGVNYNNLQYYPQFQDENGDPDYEKINQEKFRWLEYYKIKFSGVWYNRIYDKLVLRAKTELGIMGRYNKNMDIPPFERFYLGGDMPVGYNMDSREFIPLRGYDYGALNRQPLQGGSVGGTVYNKFSLELRYPLTLKPQASIYVLSFAEGANTYADPAQYNPFLLKRSAGVGIRVFMPMFGLLGIDFGYGFDTVYDRSGRPFKPGWKTSFIINQQL
jgi:outer membrane protein insertion porin family